MGNQNIDQIIEEIKTGSIINELDVVFILRELKEILFTESNLLILQSPIIICGDIHGQLDDLLKLFKVSGDTGNSLTQHYLFMGDYVDRGYFGLNTFLLLACYKIKYNNLVHMLRGNHESRQITFKYGLYSEINANYGHQGLYTMINDVFDFLPLAAVVDNDIFAVHGGLSPDLNLLSTLQGVKRNVEVPSVGLLADLLWSDPEEIKTWRPNMRGSGYIFGEIQNREFLHNNHLKIVMRSHQLAMDGYKYYFTSPEQQSKNGTKGDLLLVWSAPNYMYTSNNMATVCKFNFPGYPKYHLVEFGPEENRIQPPGGIRDTISSQYFL